MADTPGASPSVEVVYATPQVQQSVTVPYEPGLTAERAVRLSGLVERFTEIRERPLVLGVFGVRVALKHVLAAGDRVEICRPLLREPRERRRDFALRKGAKD